MTPTPVEKAGGKTGYSATSSTSEQKMFHQCWRDIHTTSTSNNPQRRWPPPVFTPVEAVDFHHYSPLFILLLGGENDKGRWKLPILVVWWCASRYMWIVVNSVCQREKGAGGDLQPQTNKTIGKKLPMRVRTSVMAVTARESKGSPVLFVCWYCKPRRDRHHGDASMQETDWHKADILAALKKKKISMAGLSREHGLSDGTLLNALNRDWPRGELIIANAIGVSPQEIWPSRYYEKDGSPKNRVIRKPI